MDDQTQDEAAKKSTREKCAANQREYRQKNLERCREYMKLYMREYRLKQKALQLAALEVV